MAAGIVWFKGFGPNDMSQSFSMDANEMQGLAVDVVLDVATKAGDRMRQIIDAGGINQTNKGGARRLSDKMYDSVDKGNDVSGSGGRVKGTFGYSDDAPLWTKFQEEGTIGAGRAKAAHAANGNGGGIASMLAFATANEEAIVFFQDKIASTKWFPHSNLR